MLLERVVQGKTAFQHELGRGKSGKLLGDGSEIEDRTAGERDPVFLVGPAIGFLEQDPAILDESDGVAAEILRIIGGIIPGFDGFHLRRQIALPIRRRSGKTEIAASSSLGADDSQTSPENAC